MEEQKRFQKKSLNSDDYKGTEQGAKVVKGVLTLALIVANEDNLKALGSRALDIAKKAVKK